MLLENLLILQIFINLSYILLNYFIYIVLYYLLIIVGEVFYEFYNEKIFYRLFIIFVMFDVFFMFFMFD